MSNNKTTQMKASVKYEHLIAGSSGGVLSTLLLHPLDLIKVRFQVNEGAAAVTANRPRYSSLSNALTVIYKEGGFRGLYQGVTPNLVGGGTSWGLYFMFYDAAKQLLQKNNEGHALSKGKHLTAGGMAGLGTLILTNPIWVAKTRLCLQYDALPNKLIPKSDPNYYRGMLDCIKKIYIQEGIRGLYRGFIPGGVGVSHGAIQFMVYEELKILINGSKFQKHDAKLGTLEYIACSALSKMVAAMVTYPYQVVRARLQDQHRSYNGIADVIEKTWRNEGARGFFKGLSVYLLHVVPNICIVFLVYEHRHFVTDICDYVTRQASVKALTTDEYSDSKNKLERLSIEEPRTV